MKIIIIIITTIIQWTLMTGAIFANKYFTLTWWMWVIIAIANMFAIGFKAYEKEDFYYPRGFYFLDIILSCALIIFLPGLKTRIIIVVVTCLIMSCFGLELENGALYNNVVSRHKISSNVLWMHALANVYYCIKPPYPGIIYRLANIAFVWIISVIFCRLYFRVRGVQLYDEQQNEINIEKEKEEKERKQAYNERKEKYERSAFYRVMKIPYNTIVNDDGAWAEYYTSTYLTDISSKYNVLFSVSIPTHDELGSTELDMIVITAGGVKVIEVKNRKLKWLIDGNDDTAYCYDQYGKKHKVKSPISQNKNHIDILEKFIKKEGNTSVRKALDILGGTVNGYVVFGDDTIGWDIANTNQGYCGYKSIGRLIQDHIDKYCDENATSDWAIDQIYMFLKEYENNTMLKNKHDTLLKIKDWKKD